MSCYNYRLVYACIEAYFILRGLMSQAGRKCVPMLQILKAGATKCLSDQAFVNI